MSEDISPFLWIRHSFCRCIFDFLHIIDDLVYIDRTIPSNIWFIDDIDHFLSRKFFILSCFCYEALIGPSTDIGIQEVFLSIPTFDQSVTRLESRHITIDLEVLVLIKPYEIYLIEDKKNESDEDVEKVCTHGFSIAKDECFSTISKNPLFSNRLMKIRIFLIALGVLLTSLLMMVWWSSYQYYVMIHADDPIQPYLTVDEGWAKIIRWDLAIELTSQEQYELEENDAIETLPDSVARVLWPDHSTTRLGPETRIVIQKMIAEPGYQNIEISFSLKKWKIWSNIVRAMVGESYFETSLPRNSIVAWVRGTVFEINLDNRYIHSINHAVSLKDGKGNTSLLMPGDIVDSEDILLVKSKEFLDRSWNSLNTGLDVVFDTERMKKTLNPLLNDGNSILWLYDRFIRFLLGHFHAFEILNIESLIATQDLENLAKIPTESLMIYYQRIQSFDIPETKEALRTSILKNISETGSGTEAILEVMHMGNLWDSLGSGTLLPSLKDSFRKSYTDMVNLPKNDLKNEARRLLNEIHATMK